MGKFMFCENGKWIIRNFGGRRMVNRVGESRRYVEPGELVVLDRSSRPNGQLPDLEIYESPSARQKKSLVPAWLKESSQVKAALIAFALGMWAVFTAAFVASLID